MLVVGVDITGALTLANRGNHDKSPDSHCLHCRYENGIGLERRVKERQISFERIERKSEVFVSPKAI